ncbi:MAG: diacylglycerol kinase [Fusobacteriota bacterium]
MKKESRDLVESFNCAVEGIIETIKNERHMKIHFFVTIFIIIISLLFDITKLELGLILFSISLVWITEIINTAIEALVDMYVQEYHELAKLAKDAAAGAVFVASVNAIIMGYLVLFDEFENMSSSVLYKITTSEIHLSVMALILVVIGVVYLKALFRRGRPFTGGMPSGHSAVGFSIWVSSWFITNNIYMISMIFIMALLISQTRVKANIHSLGEVIAGAIFGGTVTFLLFLWLAPHYI